MDGMGAKKNIFFIGINIKFINNYKVPLIDLKF